MDDLSRHPLPLLQAYPDRTRAQQADQGPARLGARVGRVRQGDQGLRHAPSPQPPLQVQAFGVRRLPAPRRRPQVGRLWPRRDRGGSGHGSHRRTGCLPGQAQGKGVRRRPADRQRRRRGRVRQGGRAQRDALVVVWSRASRAGGGGALLRHSERRRALFDVYDDTRSQVYGGKDSETSTTNGACRRTRGEVARYGKRVATTYFFSSSGGQTEAVQFGFPRSEPGALPEERQRPLRPHLTRPFVEGAVFAARDAVAARGAVLGDGFAGSRC